MIRRVSVLSLLVAVTVVIGQIVAPEARQQAPARPLPPLAQTLGVDPAIATGVLPNGLRYYVRANKTPEHRAELRLVVNAGSILEDDRQRGFAHVVEHMAFEGTRHFPRESIVGFMQSLGMGFGPHLNAETTFDNTIYQLQVPTDRTNALDGSLAILRDWAHELTFDPAAVDRERRIVTEEWRQGLGAQARLLDQQRTVLLQGSRYADRLPIGRMDVVQSATADELRAFYTEWYRPDLMSVIAVGDFDRAHVVSLVNDDFGTLTNPSPERPRPTYPLPNLPGTRYAIATDREATNTTVAVTVLAPAADGSTVAGYRQELTAQVFSALMDARFDQASRQANAPFLAATADRSLFARGEQASSLTALVPETGIARGVQALLAEHARVSRDGFTPTELDRIKRSFGALIDRVLAERDKRQSSAFADEYIRAFTTGEALPSLEDEMDMRRQLLAAMTVADVNAVAPGWTPDHNRTISVATGQKAGVAVPDQPALAAAVAAASAKPLPKYAEDLVKAPLVEHAPVPGTIARTATHAPGLTEWTLSNGATVVLKPTLFKQDEILFRAFAFGGTSLASDKDFVAAETAASVVGLGGVGRLSSLDLEHQLAGKVARVDPFISATSEGLAGGSSKRDVETLMQLIYLRFTAPRADPAAFATVQTQLRTLLANQQSRPETALGRAVTAALTQNHPRAQPLAIDQISAMNLERSLTFYKDRFADASAFTFVFVGSFDPAELRPLVERYLGGLPSTRKRETWRDVGIRLPPSIVETTVQKGVEPKSQVTIVFSGPSPATDQAHGIVQQALARVLQGRLFSALRQELGGTYGVAVSSGQQRIPRPEYTFTISFACDPARTAELTSRVFADIAELKRTGPGRSQVHDIIVSFQRDLETSSQQNAWVLAEIAQAYESSTDVATALAPSELYNAINPEAIQDAAVTYLDLRRYVKVTLVPEKTTSHPPQEGFPS
jgi:zinc protease